MSATFPVHIFLLVKGKYDGFVSGNVQMVSTENAFFKLEIKMRCLLITFVFIK